MNMLLSWYARPARSVSRRRLVRGGAGLSLVLVLLFAANGAAAAADGHLWKGYIVSRFQIEFCYPADLLKPQRPPDNADGRTFRGHGAELLVWGIHDLDEPLSYDLGMALERLGEDGGRILSRSVQRNDYVLRARQRDRLFYNHTRHALGDFKAFEIRYPARQEKIWRPIVRRIESCFRSLGPSTN